MGLQAERLVARGLRAGWLLSLYPEAGEAGGCFVPTQRRAVGDGRAAGRAEHEAARRARGKVRRYCAANRLNKLGTLTYAGVGCHDPRRVRGDASRFFRRLKADLGGESLPYLWVPEWHKTDHGLHLHFAVGKFIKRSTIERAWGHGFVHIKQIGDVPVGASSLHEARIAARYLGKYVGKSFDDRRVKGLHRYERAQGHDPRKVIVEGRSRDEVVERASVLIGSRPDKVWSSDDEREWFGPPSVWAQWAA